MIDVVEVIHCPVCFEQDNINMVDALDHTPTNLVGETMDCLSGDGEKISFANKCGDCGTVWEDVFHCVARVITSAPISKADAFEMILDSDGLAKGNSFASYCSFTKGDSK